ncbi:MAG: (d)CMP kinase [Paracoccaceae bacterium]
MKFVVAIDGTAGSGKGTLGKRIAEHFDFHYLDTGILYRIVAYYLQYNSDFSKISKQKVQTSLKLLNNKNFSSTDLRNEKITLIASEISKNKIVRDNLLFYQRDFALQNGGAVLDGRDIGTVVCPDADVKIFVDADINLRAKRRYDQLFKNTKDLNLKKILDDLAKRDNLDKNREFSPMVPAKDAFLLDTSNLTVEEALKKIIVIISKKLEK